jgi:hypothetical protein
MPEVEDGIKLNPDGTLGDCPARRAVNKVLSKMSSFGSEVLAIEFRALLTEHPTWQSDQSVLNYIEAQLSVTKAHEHYKAETNLIPQVKPQTPAVAVREMPKLRTISDVIAEKVDWLWYPYIPKGKVTLFEGDPGVGKSWVSLAIATATSLGSMLPGIDSVSSGPVMIASAEDGIADTIKPRLDAMGADQKEIHAVDGLLTLDNTGFDMLENLIQEKAPILTIIDPLVAYLSGDVDINKANQVRFGMARLAGLADKYDMAILAVRHLTKGNNTKAIYRGLGSIDFTAAARSVLFAGSDPDDDSNRAIDHIKSNLSPKGDPIGYEIRDGCFYWKQTTTLTYESMNVVSEGKDALTEAKEYLQDTLSSGGMPSLDIQKDADKRGIRAKTLRRARESLKIVAYNIAVKGREGAGKWHWKLPEEVT